MKKTSILFLIISIFAFITSCSHSKKPEQLIRLVDDVISLDPENLSKTESISLIATKLESKADKIILIKKSNIAEALSEAQKFSKVFIVIEKHTLIKISDLNNCQKSTSWGTGMPKGIGFVKKSGIYEKENDYINNLLGKPDNQVRKMYLFK